MKEKCFFALLIIFFILILGACTNLQAKNDPMSILSTSNTTIEDNQESVSSQPTEVDTSGDVYEELALNDHHHIQANVQGEEYTNLESFALEPLPVTIEEVVKIFAPDDSGEGTVKSTEEGTFLISNKGNHFYISQHRVLFEKEDEAQRQKNDEIINLLNLYAQDNPKNSAQDLDFINRNDAIQLVEDLLKKVGVNLKPILRAYVSLPAQTIMDAYFRISPVTLAQLSQLASKRSIYGVDLMYAVIFFAISIFILTTLCVLSQCVDFSKVYRRRRSIHG